jgi:hypothetical protein
MRSEDPVRQADIGKIGTDGVNARIDCRRRADKLETLMR